MDGIMLLLMAIIWLYSFVQDDKVRFTVAMIFVIPLVAHDFIFHSVIDSRFYYYIGLINISL